MKQNSTELQRTAASSGPGDEREEAGLLESRNVEGNLTQWDSAQLLLVPLRAQ